ncbi:acrEF/envCD operon transcriptional regulator [Enterobacteriaceae bacterium RIT691]|nr:acrEF/envCD operon transcriptional regulator [Enterobacteriaceae bacterium RIT691]
MVRKTKADALVTRQQLISAAIEQFALRGVSETTLTDIADATGMTRGAVYWHFKSKAEIFNEIWSQQLPLRDIIQHRLTQNERENPLAFMREMFVVALQYISQTPKQRALMQILYHKCEFSKEMMPESEIRERLCFRYEKIRGLLIACVRNGSIPADTNIETSLIILHSFFSGVLKNWLLEPQKFSLFQQAPELVDSILTILRPQVACWPLRNNNTVAFRPAV